MPAGGTEAEYGEAPKMIGLVANAREWYTEFRSSRIATVSSIREPSAGLPPSVASHSLRHSIAVHSLEEGFGLEYVADLLGHASIRSTAIYARITSRGRDPR